MVDARHREEEPVMHALAQTIRIIRMSPKSHERRIHGHRHARIRLVLEGPTLMLIIRKSQIEQLGAHLRDRFVRAMSAHVKGHFADRFATLAVTASKPAS